MTLGLWHTLTIESRHMKGREKVMSRTDKTGVCVCSFTGFKEKGPGNGKESLPTGVRGMVKR